MNWGDRKSLPSRRDSTVITMRHAFDMGANEQKYYVTAGFYPDGSIGECFINTHQTSVAGDAYAKDAAIAVSIALQYGAPLKVLCDAMSRRYAGKEPLSPIGAMCDVLAGIEGGKT